MQFFYYENDQESSNMQNSIVLQQLCYDCITAYMHRWCSWWQGSSWSQVDGCPFFLETYF